MWVHEKDLCHPLDFGVMRWCLGPSYTLHVRIAGLAFCLVKTKLPCSTYHLFLTDIYPLFFVCVFTFCPQTFFSASLAHFICWFIFLVWERTTWIWSRYLASCSAKSLGSVRLCCQRSGSSSIGSFQYPNSSGSPDFPHSFHARPQFFFCWTSPGEYIQNLTLLLYPPI